MRKIDVHCHTTTREVKGTPDGDATLRNIARYMENHDIDRTVLLASYFPHKGSGISNYRLLNWIDKFDPDRHLFVMFASLDADRYPRMGYNEIRELAENGVIHGVKVYTCYQDIDLEDPDFSDIVRVCIDWNMPMMFHTGHSYATQRKYGKDSLAPLFTADDFIEFAHDHADLRIILSHMSKPFFHQIVRVCSECSNVWTDMSGIIDSAYDQSEIPVCVEEIRTFIRKAGADKMLFGTDFPVQTHQHSVDFIEKATEGMGDDTRAKIYFKNAEMVLQIPFD